MFFGTNYNNQHRVTIIRTKRKYNNKTNLAIVGPVKSGKTSIIRDEIISVMEKPESFIIYIGYFRSMLGTDIISKLEELKGDSIKNVRMYKPEDVYDALDVAKQKSAAGKNVWVYFDDMDFYIQPELEEIKDFLFIAASYHIKCAVLMQTVGKETAGILDECHFKFIICGTKLKDLPLTAKEKRFLHAEANQRGLLTYDALLSTRDGTMLNKRHVAYVIREEE